MSMGSSQKKYILKTILQMKIETLMNKCYLVLVFLLLYTIGFSQGYIPITTTMKTPMGNIPYTYQVYTAPMNYYRNAPVTSQKGDFIIVLKNDSTVHTRARLDLSDSVHRIEIKKKKITSTILPHDTKQITLVWNTGLEFVGIPADSCWLFQVNVGKINSYSVVPYDTDPIIVAIQKGKDGPIIPLSKKNLRDMVGDDPKLNELIDKEKFEKVIRQYNRSK